MYELSQFHPVEVQREILWEILQTNQELQAVLAGAKKLAAPHWYIGAGAIAQTVWNYFHDFPADQGIKDYDLVYFDEDTSYEAEDNFIQQGKEIFKAIGHEVEIRNQARVHLWYKNKFGYDILPYISVEQAITTWPTTATAVAIHLNQDNFFHLFAPYGLHDLLGMIVRPNKVKITEQIYLEKVQRWQKVWPKLQIIPW